MPVEPFACRHAGHGLDGIQQFSGPGKVPLLGQDLVREGKPSIQVLALPVLFGDRNRVDGLPEALLNVGPLIHADVEGSRRWETLSESLFELGHSVPQMGSAIRAG